MEAARDLVALRMRWGRLCDYKAGRPQTPAGQENQGGTVLSFDSGTCAMKKTGGAAVFGRPEGSTVFGARNAEVRPPKIHP